MKLFLISLTLLASLLTGGALRWAVKGPNDTRQPGGLSGKPEPTKPRNVVFIFADDMSPTLGCYGDSVAPTPTIDRLARQGFLFGNAFCSAPSCSPSRGAVLTGRYPHQLAEGTNLWSTLPIRYPNYVSLLAAAGYRTGLTGKGWGPGNYEVGGYAHNPAGPSFASFKAFMQEQKTGQPFCFWLGPHDPHRPYDPALKQTMGLRPQYLKVPAYLPDSPEVRADLLDYYAETARVERDVAEVVRTLEQTGNLANTLIVVSGDNGLPFPRAKANLYDAGTRIPLIIWGGQFTGGRRVAAPVNLIDLAPTFLEVAGLPRVDGMEGQSLTRFVTGNPAATPVFLERERHAEVRAGNLGYPARAIRTTRFLFIQNLKPDRWPAGDPEYAGSSGVVTRRYGDIDDGPAKQYLIDHREQYRSQAEGAIAKRPAEELYDLEKDPDQLQNVVDQRAYQKIKNQLRQQLMAWRNRTHDPRLSAAGDIIDTYPYYGNQSAKPSK